MSILGAPVVQLIIKAGTTGAAIMGGSRIVSEGVQYVAGWVDEHTPFKPKILPVIAGPLDTITTLLDPLDITGTRKRKEQAAAKKKRDAQRKAKREAKKRKAAESAAAQADQVAADATARAEAAEARAAEAEKRANTAEAARKRAEANRQRNWATMARRTAAQARTEAAKAPDLGAELAKMALDMAKTALKPPENPAQAFAPGMNPQAQSLAAQIVDEMNRMNSEPDFDAILGELMAGDQQAASLGLLSHAGIYGQVSGYDDDDDDVGGDDDDDDDIGGDDDDDELVVSGTEKKAKAKAKTKEAPPTEAEEEGFTVAGCCESCATSGSRCGASVPHSMIDGSILEGEDDDVVEGDDDISEVLLAGSFDDESLIEGDDGSDDFMIAGPRYRTHGKF
jgi:chemotaxis protein histidine kinase CheA